MAFKINGIRYLFPQKPTESQQLQQLAQGGGTESAKDQVAKERRAERLRRDARRRVIIKMLTKNSFTVGRSRHSKKSS